MTAPQEMYDLIDRHLHGELSEAEKARLASWLDTDPEARRQFIQHVQWNTELAEAVRESEPTAIAEASTASLKKANRQTTSGVIRALRSLLVLAILVIIGLATVLVRERTAIQPDTAWAENVNPSIARITGLSGSVIWTGDRGEIVRDIAVGTELSGGTIEGMAPDSWCELLFHDGSEVMISGNSMLTFSDADQKVLRLREGRLSAVVEPQPEGRPMLIHTRTALLKVLGTQFDIESGLAATSLNVSEGKVRIRRLSDGSEVDVTADHRVVADDERSFTPVRVSAAVNAWKTDLQRKPDNYGKWQPASENRPASLKAIPLAVPKAPDVTLHLAGVSVEQSDASPVVVVAGSRFRVKGRIQLDAPIYFGIRVNRPNGEFAGMFRGDQRKQQPPTHRDDSGFFEEVYELDDFTVDPAVWDKRDELADHPSGLVLDGVWAFTHTQPPSGLELTEIELLPPKPDLPQSAPK